MKIYTQAYRDPDLRGIEEPRPWDIKAYLSSIVKKTDVVVDLGAGTGEKTFHLADTVQQLIAIDPSEAMRHSLVDNARRQRKLNISVVDGHAGAIPLENESVDVIVCLVARFVASEMYRVLRPGGRLVLETTTDQDKGAIKSAFERIGGVERGQFCGLSFKPFAAALRAEFDSSFVIDESDLVRGAWRGKLSAIGLKKLLQQTNTIRGYKHSSDCETLKKVISEGIDQESWIPVIHERVRMTGTRRAEIGARADEKYSIWREELSKFPDGGKQELL